MFTKESLEVLRQRIDLVDVLSSYIPLQRSGSSYKSLCPFHEEKTPSFIVQKGDTHYHCFGCGAHGDAIAFLMTHMKMGFQEAVEHLAERFQVILEKSSLGAKETGPSKAALRQALESAHQLYHYLLLHSEEGQVALQYLYSRGLDLEFIRAFEIGFAPKASGVLVPYLKTQGVQEEVMVAAGLLSTGKYRDFFSDRIIFPIRDAVGHVIGFSGRKFKEETFGGKYVNTPETLLFKKSKVLFGLSYSRSRIAKEAQAIIVEGQIDALRLIHMGFNYTVAGQGTAFGEEHVRELVQLGVKKVFLALDADRAGQEASVKIGHLFQKKGVEVFVVSLPVGSDPDSLLREQGPETFNRLLQEATQYLLFLFSYLSKGEEALSAARKNEIVTAMAERIKQWEMPVMVHESLKKVAQIAHIPEMMLDVGSLPAAPFIQKRAMLQVSPIDPHRILEADLIRWLLVAAPTCPEIMEQVKNNIHEGMFSFPLAQCLYQKIVNVYEVGKAWDLIELCSDLEGENAQQFLAEVMQRKVNVLKAVDGCKETIRKLLHREWMHKREAIFQEISSGLLSEKEAVDKLKEFDALKNTPPQLQ